MKAIKMVILILLLIPTVSFAGEIYGTITYDNGQPFAKQKVKITTPDNQVIESATDDNGYFTITIPSTGKCTLETGGCSTDVYSNDGPNGYTLSIVNANTTECQLKKQ